MRFFRGIIVFLLILNGCAGGPPRGLSHAPEGVQSIRFWHKPSGERSSVAFRMGGRYSETAFAEIDHIFRDRRTGEEYNIDPGLIEMIAGLRDRMALPPDTEIELLSGYRSPDTNAMLARTNRHVAKDSYHMKGMAADIRIPGMSAGVLELVARTQQKGGVALYPDSGHVHVDTGPVRGWSVHRGYERGLSRAGSAAGKKAGVTTRQNREMKGPSAIPLTPREKTQDLKRAPREQWEKTVKPSARKPAARTPAKKKAKKAPVKKKGNRRQGTGNKQGDSRQGTGDRE